MIIKRLNCLKPVFILFPGLLLLLVLLLAGCVGGGHYIAQARESAASEDWDKSVEFFEKACKADPDDIEARMMLARAKWKASLAHMIKGQKFLEKRLFEDAVLEFRKSLLFNPDNQKAIFLIKKSRNMRESEENFVKGQHLLHEGKYSEARKAFQRSAQLDPENKEACKAVAFYQKIDNNAPRFRLKYKTGAPVSLKFKQTPIVNVFEVLTKIAGINFIFDKDLKESKVTLFLTDVSFGRFMEILLKTNNLAARAVDEKTLIIYPDTPAKRREYQNLRVRTFYLAHLKAQKAAGLLSKILKARDITVNEKLNSIIIRGSEDVIAIASKIITANDRLPAEALLSVEILEVSRSKEKQFGLEYSESFTIGLGEKTSGVSADTGLVDWISMADLDTLSNKELIMSTPQATLNILKQDTDTRLLANPQLRVKNGEKASILIGERIPLRVNRRVDSSTGDVTSDYQYHDVGVKMEVEPVINMNSEISMKILLDVSSLGPNVGTVDDPQYSINTRTASSVLTVHDGELVIFGGLIKDIERKTIRKVPLLGDIPAIGHLFSNQDSDRTNTDILMVIKPIIIRNQTVPEADVVEMWSGNEKDFSLREPYESRAACKEEYLNRADKEQLRRLFGKAIGNPDSRSPEIIKMEPLAKAETNELPENIHYSIHVNSFKKQGDARLRVRELKELGCDAFIMPANIPGKGLFYRIFTGAFSDYESAMKACTKLKETKGFRQDIHVADRKWMLAE